jgi:hypothetical protein
MMRKSIYIPKKIGIIKQITEIVIARYFFPNFKALEISNISRLDLSS